MAPSIAPGAPRSSPNAAAFARRSIPNGLPTGEAVITTGGNLKARHVIHTVGPIYGQNGGRDAELLANCYTNAIALAAATGLATIAFPAISTGVYGYPKEEAKRVSMDAVTRALLAHPSIREVRLVYFS
jgi:O-acetyl-ADP-ribose deacetylase (regulator of RNase III)